MASRRTQHQTECYNRLLHGGGRNSGGLYRTAVAKATRRVEALRARHARYRTIVRAKAKLERCEAAEKVYLERT